MLTKVLGVVVEKVETNVCPSFGIGHCTVQSLGAYFESQPRAHFSCNTSAQIPYNRDITSWVLFYLAQRLAYQRQNF